MLFLKSTRNQIIIAMALGILTGLYGTKLMHSTSDIISEIYIKFLSLVSTPLIFLSITSTLSRIEGFSEVKFLGKRVMFYTIMTTLIAAISALALFLIISPSTSPEGVEPLKNTVEFGTYRQFLMGLIPDNIIAAFLKNNVIGIMLIAFLIGFATLSLETEKKQALSSLFNNLFDMVIKATSFILKMIPVAIWAFVTLFITKYGDKFNLGSLGLYFMAIIGANLFQGLVVLPLYLLYKGYSPLAVARGYMPAITIAFFSKSSNAALPLTLRCAQENLGISKRVSNFSLPLCVTCNMNGCAAFILITVLFVAQSHGVTFTGPELIGWVFLASLAAIGNAGIPMGCYFLASAFLGALDIPLVLMGLILPLYALIDMVETALNVWSDGVVTAIVEKDVNTITANEQSKVTT